MQRILLATVTDATVLALRLILTLPVRAIRGLLPDRRARSRPLRPAPVP
ncbi:MULTISPECIES: hypothetical protein [Methylobacterium]